jgi:hypothetical protein
MLQGDSGQENKNKNVLNICKITRFCVHLRAKVGRFAKGE